MRILFTQETDWITQNSAQLHHLAEMLSLRGHEVHVIDYGVPLRREGNISVMRPAKNNLPVLNYISLFPSHRKEINKQIIEFKPEVIVGWGILNSYIAARAAKKNKIPFIYYWIDILHRRISNILFRPIGRMIEKKALKKSDMVLAINGKVKDYVLSIGAPVDNTQVIKAGIELERFDANLHGMNIRNKYGLNNQDRVLFFLGWLYNFSGLDDVIQSLSKRRDFRLKLLIVGEGDAYDDLEILRSRYKFGNRVILTGKKDYSEIPGLIATADICILPTDPSEPTMQDIVPIEIYEYMAMKKLVITTKLPGVMKEFGEGNGVIYVDKPEEVVQKAEDLLNNGTSSVTQLGQLARKYIENNSWDKITSQFESTLEKVVSG